MSIFLFWLCKDGASPLIPSSDVRRIQTAADIANFAMRTYCQDTCCGSTTSCEFFAHVKYTLGRALRESGVDVPLYYTYCTDSTNVLASTLGQKMSDVDFSIQVRTLDYLSSHLGTYMGTFYEEPSLILRDEYVHDFLAGYLGAVSQYDLGFNLPPAYHGDITKHPIFALVREFLRSVYGSWSVKLFTPEQLTVVTVEEFVVLKPFSQYEGDEYLGRQCVPCSRRG